LVTLKADAFETHTSRENEPMVNVSERAKERLLEQKQAANLDDSDVGLRVAAGPTGQWTLVADHVREDDQVVEHRGSTVLLLDPVAQSVLDGAEVDCVETTDGDIELVLVAVGEADDENDDENDDESER
jgi:Fe-S cluster assembly iron-binding protein IscA